MSADNERFTLDTNLLVYAIDNAAAARHDAAGQIIQHAVRVDCWLTLQAVSEFYAVVTRKGIVQPPDAAAQAADWLDLFPCAAASEAAVRSHLPMRRPDVPLIGMRSSWRPQAKPGVESF